MAEDAPAKPKRVTLKDVAKAADVSLGSASYAINGNGSTDERTRAHILKVAKKLGYRQNMNAQAMRTGRTKALGLVLPDFSNQFFTALAQFVMRSARQHGYSVFVTDTEGSEALEREALTVLSERGVEGIVWFPIRDTNTAEALTQDIPTVVMDRTIGGLEAVQADYVGGGRLAAEHLIALGHRDIGVISGPMDVSSVRERVRGARDAIEAGGGRVVFCAENAFSIDLDPLVARAISGRTATAVICGADLIALGAIKYAATLGLNVPGDLSVVGFDDIPWAQLSTPPLTTVEMPIEDMAAEAVDVLLRRMEGRANARRQVVFATALIERGSTRALTK
jgi:LacI family transcriptional regulator